MYAYATENDSVAVCRKLQGVPKGTPYIQPTELPDSKYRDAWRIVGEEVVIDTPLQAPIVMREVEQAIQGLLDAKAQELGYDNVVTACSYVGTSNPRFAAEAAAMLEWRSGCWAKAYELLGAWKAQSISQPTVEEVLSQLPVYGAS